MHSDNETMHNHAAYIRYVNACKLCFNTLTSRIEMQCQPLWDRKLGALSVRLKIRWFLKDEVTALFSGHQHQNHKKANTHP